jgi:hypothetical protein
LAYAILYSRGQPAGMPGVPKTKMLQKYGFICVNLTPVLAIPIAPSATDAAPSFDDDFDSIVEENVNRID